MTNLLNQHDIIVDKLGKGNNMDLTFLDFAKVYNCIDYSILLYKLHDKVNQWASIELDS